MPLPDDFGVLESQLTQHGFVKRPLTDRDVAVGALIQASKLLGLGSYRKTTAKTVNTTISETDLLNSEITIAASALGSTGALRLTAFGDWKQNSGGASGPPRIKLKLGATTIIDTGAGNATGIGNSATRFPWKIDVVIANSATNVQWTTFRLVLGMVRTAATSFNALTTGEGEFYSLVDAGASANEYIAHGGNSSAVDTTVASALVLSTINASANANYEVVLKNAIVEVL